MLTAVGIKESEVSSEQRQKAKALVLGLLYSLSAAGLPRYAYNNFSVEISPDEAEDLERFARPLIG
jgi:DNA polymerase I-like protein with 3'-5' exonuclease and polymerase domains